MRSNYQYKHLLHKKLRRLSSLLICGFAASSVSFAQDDEDDEEIFELSPFTVEAEEGWVATQTLAGSRLKTDFRDVPAQIETMTMDFMDDFAVNSVEEALIYSVNVANPDDRIAGNGEGFGNAQINNFSQIRGVGGATNAREFFATDMPTDNYNLSRATIASGPQSILFGTGSPAGVINVTMNRANFGGDKGKFEVQVDDFGSHRVVLDYNKILIEDKLALRFALLNEERQQEWDPNFDKDNRYYATFLFKPTDKTTFSFHYEDSQRRPNRVNRFLPFDNVQAWYEAGQPAFDNGPNAARSGNGNFQNLPDIFTQHNNQVVSLIDSNGNVANPISYRQTVEVESRQDLPGVNPLDFEADNWTILDTSIFPVDVNHQGLASFAEWNSDHYNIFFEHQLMENWHISVAYNKEETTEFSWDPGTQDRTINVDPNLYMPDGVTPNPHFGEFYTEGRGNIAESIKSRENYRIMMSYELDFTNRDSWVSLFGRQRFGYLVSEDRSTNMGQQGIRYRVFLNDNGETPSFPDSQASFAAPGSRRWAADGDRQFSTRQYLTEENGYFTARPNIAFDGSPLTFVDEAGVPFTMDAFNTGFVDDGFRMSSPNGAQFEWEDQKTRQFSYQGFMWDNRIVLTYGVIDTSSVGRDTASNTPGRSNDHGFFPYFKDVQWGDFREEQSGKPSTQGIIVRPVEWISLFYNESDTWQPNIGRFDPYGTEYPGAQGEGEDYGVRLELMNRKLSIKYNEFDLTAGPSRAANTPFNRWRDPLWNVENRWRNLVEDPTYPGQGTGGFRERGRCCYWVMSDNTSEGKEITIQATPIDNLNLRFTYTDREAKESNIGLIWFEYMAERLAVWQSLNVPEGGFGTSTTLDNGTVVPGQDMNGDGQIGTWTWDTAWYNNNNPEGDPNDGDRTLSEYYEEITVNGPIGSAVIQALDGKPNEFDRQKRWNFNASYRFTDGIFDGFTVGGAARWREAPVVGHASKDVSGNENIDLDAPYFGGEEFYIDAFARYRGKLKWLGDRDYDLQLNVRNLLDKDDYISVIKGVEGNNLRMAKVEGRRVSLSFGIDI